MVFNVPCIHALHVYRFRSLCASSVNFVRPQPPDKIVVQWKLQVIMFVPCQIDVYKRLTVYMNYIASLI